MHISLVKSFVENIWIWNSNLWMNLLRFLAIVGLSEYLHFTLSVVLWFRSTFVAAYRNIWWRSLHHSLNPLNSLMYNCFKVGILILWFQLKGIRFLCRWDCPLRSRINRLDIQYGIIESGWHFLLVFKLCSCYSSHWSLVKWGWLCSTIWLNDKCIAIFILCFA